MGFFFTFLILFFAFSEKKSNNIKFDDFEQIINATIGTSGGDIIVDDNNASINGFKIQIPQDAYEKDIDFTISEAQITSHKFGIDFEPITPLININNGSVFSNHPLLVTIPIEISSDEFAMGFYYDEKTGELEGIPFIESNENSIVLLTNHFSHIVVSKTKVGRILGDIETGFKVKRNNIQTPNYGTYLEIGHCAGQTIAEIYHYQNRGRIGWDEPLYGLLDNNGGPKTPKLWQDDALQIRLNSVLQNHKMRNWYNPEYEFKDALESYRIDLGKDDEKSYYAIAYAMQLTKNPQLVVVRGESGGHALTAYKIIDNQIYVADPNYPKDDDRKITFKRDKDDFFTILPKFEPYYSGANAQQATAKSVKYDKIGYYGAFALINREVVADLWLQVKNGTDVGVGLFPEDVDVEIAVGIDEKENLIAGKIRDGIRPDTNSVLYVRIPNQKNDEQISIYNGSEFIGFLSKDWSRIQLADGTNSIGIYHEKKRANEKYYSYVNFRRYDIINSEEAVEEIEEVGNFEELIGKWHFEGTLTDHITPEKYGQPNDSIFLVGNIYVENNQTYISFVELEDLMTEPVSLNINEENLSFVLNGTDNDGFKITFKFDGEMYTSEGELKIRGEGSTEAWDQNNEYGYGKYNFLVYKYTE